MARNKIAEKIIIPNNEKILCDYEVDNILGMGIPYTEREIWNRRIKLGLERPKKKLKRVI